MGRALRRESQQVEEKISIPKLTVRVRVLGGKLALHCLFDVLEKNSAAL